MPWGPAGSNILRGFSHYSLLTQLPAQRRGRSLRSLYCCSDDVRGRGAAVTNLSHSTSFHSREWIAPSNRGIKHLAPYVLTANKERHPAALDIAVSVNGAPWGGGNSRDMLHDFADIVAHISASETLYPGEVNGSGTVGTGCGLETGRFLSDGDSMDLTIQGIGTPSPRIVKPADKLTCRSSTPTSRPESGRLAIVGPLSRRAGAGR
nr:fumarylacetoacetate hydrolase family protein [Ruegeria sediminis]